MCMMINFNGLYALLKFVYVTCLYYTFEPNTSYIFPMIVLRSATTTFDQNNSELNRHYYCMNKIIRFSKLVHSSFCKLISWLSYLADTSTCLILVFSYKLIDQYFNFWFLSKLFVYDFFLILDSECSMSEAYCFKLRAFSFSIKPR